jgi:membrane protein DedA with SNARE-associated domain
MAEIVKTGAISVAVAIIFAVIASYTLELSSEGIKNITFISVVICLALGQGIRWLWSRRRKP